jgi:toxin ParE1/3/4
MSDVVVFTKPRARIDFAQYYAYLGIKSPDAARRFLQAAEATFLALARTPGMGTPNEVSNPRLEGLRCPRVRRFRNSLIFYRSIPRGIDVIRVLHAARDIGDILEAEGGE